MRPPSEIFDEYRTRIAEARALMAEWILTADELRGFELAALFRASREASDALMAEYRDACAARARQLARSRLVGE